MHPLNHALKIELNVLGLFPDGLIIKLHKKSKDDRLTQQTFTLYRQHFKRINTNISFLKPLALSQKVCHVATMLAFKI